MTISAIEQMTIIEIVNFCKQRGITGYSAPRKEGKAALVRFVEQALNMVVESVAVVPVSEEQSLEKHFHSLCDEAEKFAEEFLAREAAVVPVPDQDEDEDDVPGADRVVCEAGGEIICLSVEPAMAYAIAHLGKPIENRSWRTNYKGWLHIHASKSKTHYHAHRRYIESLGMKCPDWEDLPKGCLVCKVWLDRVSAAPAPASAGYVPWGINGQYWWFLRDAQPVEHIPMKGQLGLFKAEVSVTVSEEAAKEAMPTPTKKPDFEPGDLVEVCGFRMDGRRGIVAGSGERGGVIVCFPDQSMVVIPGWALKKRDETTRKPVPKAAIEKLSKATETLLSSVSMKAKLTQPTLDGVDDGDVYEAAAKLIENLSRNETQINYAAAYAISLSANCKEIEEFLENNFRPDNNAAFPYGKLPHFCFEILAGLEYVEDSLDATEAHFAVLAKRGDKEGVKFFCGYANLKTGKAFTVNGDELSVSLKFARIKLLTKGETVREAFGK